MIVYKKILIGFLRNLLYEIIPKGLFKNIYQIEKM